MGSSNPVADMYTALPVADLLQSIVDFPTSLGAGTQIALAPDFESSVADMVFGLVVMPNTISDLALLGAVDAVASTNTSVVHSMTTDAGGMLGGVALSSPALV